MPDGRQSGTKAATLVDSSAYDARVELSRHGIVWRAVSAEPPAMPRLTSSSSSRCLSQSATGCPGEQASNARMTPARRRKAYGARSPPVGIGIAAWCSRHAGLLPRRITSTSMQCWSGAQHRQEGVGRPDGAHSRARGPHHAHRCSKCNSGIYINLLEHTMCCFGVCRFLVVPAGKR